MFWCVRERVCPICFPTDTPTEPGTPTSCLSILFFLYHLVTRCAAVVRGAGGAGRGEPVWSLQQPGQSHLRGAGERHDMPDGGVRGEIPRAI